MNARTQAPDRTTMTFTSLLALLTAALVALALALAPAAAAQSSSLDTYGGQGGGNVAGAVQSGGDPSVDGASDGASADPGASGSLPFTGLDLALAAAGGILLLGVGATLAGTLPRHRRHHDPTEAQG
jgi:hypothetical protein